MSAVHALGRLSKSRVARLNGLQAKDGCTEDHELLDGETDFYREENFQKYKYEWKSMYIFPLKLELLSV